MARIIMAPPPPPPVTLELTNEEARWLRDYLQNCYVDPTEEPPEQLKHRRAIWEALASRG